VTSKESLAGSGLEEVEERKKNRRGTAGYLTSRNVKPVGVQNTGKKQKG